MIRLTPSKTNFAKGVSFAKKIGCKFDATDKVWMRSEDALWSFIDASKRADQTRESYLRANGLEIVESAPISAAQTWHGQASMDHEESHF